MNSSDGSPAREDLQSMEIDDSGNVLDLTSYQLHSLDTVELPPTLTELDLTANRLSGLDSRISQLSSLKKLSLRQNLIDDSGVEPLSRWEALSDLEVILAVLFSPFLLFLWVLCKWWDNSILEPIGLANFLV